MLRQRRKEERVEVTVRQVPGLHLRSASELVRRAKKFKCRIWIEKEGKRANAKEVLDILTLAAAAGSRLAIVARGPRAREAVEALGALVEDRLGKK